MKLLQYKDKRIESKEAGVKVLEETNKALSSIIAKGAAGGILVDEGNILVAQQVSLRNGIEDFNVAQINQEIMQNLGIVEFTNLRAAGKAAKQAGIMSAIFGFGTDMATLGQTGAFDKKA